MQPQQVLVTAIPQPNGTGVDFKVELADGTSKENALKLLGQAVIVLAGQPDAAAKPLFVPPTPDQVEAVAAAKAA